MQDHYGAISLGDSLEVIADETRRAILLELRECERLDQRAVENDVLPSGSSPQDALVRLRHVHLPKLEEFGLVEWHSERNEIHRDSAYEEIEPLIELLDENSEAIPGEWL